MFHPSFILVALVLILLVNSIKILKEYERGVVFRLGRYVSVRGPGLIILIPYIEKMTKVSLRTVVMDVPPQDVITKDNVSVKVNAVLYFRAIEPEKAILESMISYTQQASCRRQLCEAFSVSLNWTTFLVKERLLTKNYKTL